MRRRHDSRLILRIDAQKIAHHPVRMYARILSDEGRASLIRIETSTLSPLTRLMHAACVHEQLCRRLARLREEGEGDEDNAKASDLSEACDRVEELFLEESVRTGDLHVYTKLVRYLMQMAYFEYREVMCEEDERGAFLTGSKETLESSIRRYLAATPELAEDDAMTLHESIARVWLHTAGYVWVDHLL